MFSQVAILMVLTSTGLCTIKVPAMILLLYAIVLVSEALAHE